MAPRAEPRKSPRLDAPVYPLYNRRPLHDRRARLESFRMSRRRLVLAAILALPLLAGAWAGLWFLAAAKARQAALDWIEAKRTQGYHAAHGAIEARGFPFSLRLEIARPAFGAGPDGAEWLWRTDWVTVHIEPWNLRELALSAPGAHIIELARRGGRVSYLLDAGWLDAILTLSRDWDLEGVFVELREAEFGHTDRPERASLAGLDVNFRLPPDPGEGAPRAELGLAIDQLGLPANMGAPLGDTVEFTFLDLALYGRIAPGPLKDALDEWRRAGGTVEIRRMEGKWGLLGTEGEGTAALDGRLQPMGAFTARLSGYGEAIDRLVETEWVRPTEGATAKVLLNLVSKPGPDGVAEVRVPLTVQDGGVFVGPASLMALPPVRWE